RRHRVLVVTLEGKRYLTETGMNSEGPRAPLVLAESEAQWDGVTEYRFSRDAFWGWVLWKRSPGGAWRRLYGFT
ncbi:acetyltransferase, partial [[Clostridium] symbiosum]